MRYQHLSDWLEWQSGLNSKEIDLGLERVSKVWRRLCPDGITAQVITIAGTNGKGSCVAMLEAIYSSSGYNVGAFTSPHIHDYCERIRINQRNADEVSICEGFARIDAVRDDLALTYFEWSTLCALWLFQQAQLDVVILEVGLGGRLDAVNIIDADVALITTIDYDHMDWLGEDLESIGYEKAGIMRPGKLVVLGDPDMPETIQRHAVQIGASVLQYGHDYDIHNNDQGWIWRGNGREIAGAALTGLTGKIQLRNLAAVLQVVQCMMPKLAVAEVVYMTALTSVTLTGRYQQIKRDDWTIIDVAHNPQAVTRFLDNLQQDGVTGPCPIVYGALMDKNIEAVVRIMEPLADRWHLVGIPERRGGSVDALSKRITPVYGNLRVDQHQSVPAALQAAWAEAADRPVLVFGSFWLVAEALNCIG